MSVKGSCEALLLCLVEHLGALPVDEETGFLSSVLVTEFVLQGVVCLRKD